MLILQGYIIIDKPRWAEMFRSQLTTILRRVREEIPWLPKVDARETFETFIYEKSAPSFAPFRQGRFLRATESSIIIDPLRATYSLPHTLSRKGLSGARVNSLAKMFEKTTQSHIDTTPWRPTDGFVRSLVGKKLHRSDGTEITDIDAVGEYGNALLLISCKSRSVEPMDWRVDIQDVRSRVSLINRSIDEWVLKIAEIKLPCIEFSDAIHRYAIIAGVVCFPAPPWLNSEKLLASPLLGLPIAVSLDELIRWMNTGTILRETM